MQHKTANVLIKVIMLAFAAIMVLLPIHAFISTWGGTAIGPLEVWKSWKEILIVLLVPLVVWFCALQPQVARAMWRQWLNKLVLAYVLLTIIFAIISPASHQAVLAGLLMNLRFLAMLVLAQIIIFSGHPWVATLKRWLIPWLLWTTIFLGVLAILQVTVLPRDLLTHFGYNKNTTIAPFMVVDSNPHALQAFATMRGPNTLGAYLLLPLAAALAVVVFERRKLLGGIAAALGLVALFLTDSRSSWLGIILTFAVLGLLWLPRQKLRALIKWGTVPAILAVLLVAWLAVTVPKVRLAIFHSSPGDTSLTEGSTDKHWQATANGVVSAVAHPLGQGVGVAGPASFYNTHAPASIPEDYFVQIAEETGLLGLALFVAINVLVARKLWQRRHERLAQILLASFAGLTLINIFLHGWADDPTAMTWWGLAGLFIVGKEQNGE